MDFMKPPEERSNPSSNTDEKLRKLELATAILLFLVPLSKLILIASFVYHTPNVIMNSSQTELAKISVMRDEKPARVCDNQER